MTTTYSTVFFGELYAVSADWASPTSPVIGSRCGLRVCDCGSPAAAMRIALEQIGRAHV